MPQAVVHVLFTIIAIDLFRDYLIKDKRKIPLVFVFLGGIAGLLPDADIPLFWIIKHFLGIQVEWFHRTFSHSLVAFGLLALIALLVYRWREKWGILAAIIAFGVGFHIFLDFVFAGYIMPLYPFSTAAFGLDLIGRSGLESAAAGFDAIVLLAWLWHEEKKHKISDFI